MPVDQFKTISIALAVSLLFGADALAGAPVRMALGGRVAPPAGFVAFCQRDPGDCGLSPTKDAEAARPPAGSKQPYASIWPAAFAAARIATAAKGQASDQQSTAPMDPQTWSMLNTLNRRINAEITPRGERGAGADDDWTLPLETGDRSGDCEDYVLEKRRALLLSGIDPHAISIAVVVTPRNELHAVLLVNTERGELVLDNLSPWIVTWDKAPYQWRKRQTGAGPMDWAAIEFKPSGAPRRE